MSKAEKTRQYIIEKTASVFNTKGYAVTALSDIVEVTGLTKGSVYGNFRDKEEVVIEAYRHNVARLASAMDEAISVATTPLSRLSAMVTFYSATFSTIMQEGGCPMLNAAIESDDNLLFLQAPVKESFVSWHERVRAIIQAGIDDGSFKADIKAADYATTFMMLIEGGILLARTMSDKKHFSIAMDRITKIIEQEIKQ